MLLSHRPGAPAARNTVDDILTELRGTHRPGSSYSRYGEKVSRQRGLFFSPDGHIGPGPPDMKQEDATAVVGGASMPLILGACGGIAHGGWAGVCLRFLLLC